MRALYLGYKNSSQHEENSYFCFPMNKKRKGVSSKKKKGSSYSAVKGLLGIILAIVVLATFLLVYRQRFMYHPIPPVVLEKYEIKGIDVSRHNGKIDWSEVKEEGILFAYIKATESIAYIDTTFTTNYEGASKEGIMVGAYHFFRFNENGEEQARHFIKNSQYKKGDLPPVIDVEHSPFNFISRPKDVARRLHDMVRLLHAYYGVRPIIYTNKDCYKKYIRDYFPDVRLWICDLSGEPNEKEYPDWIFWQYSHRGELKGIAEKVDLDVFQGSPEKLKELSSY